MATVDRCDGYSGRMSSCLWRLFEVLALSECAKVLSDASGGERVRCGTPIKLSVDNLAGSHVSAQYSMFDEPFRAPSSTPRAGDLLLLESPGWGLQQFLLSLPDAEVKASENVLKNRFDCVLPSRPAPGRVHKAAPPQRHSWFNSRHQRMPWSPSRSVPCHPHRCSPQAPPEVVFGGSAKRSKGGRE